MKLSYPVWGQVKNITATELMRALERDDWHCDMAGGSVHIYMKGHLRVSVHYHPKKTFGEKLLRALLTDIGWSDDDARRLKIAK